MQAALSRVDSKIKTVSDVEATINSRVNSLAAATKKEVVDRKKSVETQIKDLNQKLQLLTLLPLLVQPPSAALKPGNALLSGGVDLPAVSVPDPSKLNTLLPLLLVSGLGGAGGLSMGGDSGGGDNSMMLLALVLAFAGPGK